MAQVLLGQVAGVAVTGRVIRYSRETGHRQIETLCPDDKIWPIDEMMVPLLLQLWDEGITTWVCCQGMTIDEYKARNGRGCPPDRDPRRGVYNCYLGIFGDPWETATLLTSWGLPPVAINDGNEVMAYWAKLGQPERTSIDLDVLAFREWVDAHP